MQEFDKVRNRFHLLMLPLEVLESGYKNRTLNIEPSYLAEL